MHAEPEFAVTDTAELDMELSIALDLPCYVMSIARGKCMWPASDHPRQWEAADHDYAPHKLSTTGDGRDMVERALLDRGYSICTHIFKAVTFVDVFRPHAGPAFPVPVVEDIEAPNANLAVSRAARAALEAEA